MSRLAEHPTHEAQQVLTEFQDRLKAIACRIEMYTLFGFRADLDAALAIAKGEDPGERVLGELIGCAECDDTGLVEVIRQSNPCETVERACQCQDATVQALIGSPSEAWEV